MADKKEVKKESETGKPNQSVSKALLLGIGLIVIGVFVVRGAIGDFLNFLGLIFVIVGIAQWFQNRKEKNNKR